MDSDKNVLKNIVLVAGSLILIVASVMLLMPGDMGIIAVIKKISLNAMLSVFGVLLIFLYIKGEEQIKKEVRTVCLVMGVLGVAVSLLNIFNGVRGINSGLQTVSVSHYELYSPNYTKVVKEYYIKTIVNGRLAKISVDKYTYERLQGENGSISISYYPYIEVADSVSVEAD